MRARAWFAGSLANRYGRLPVMVVAAILFLASAIGSGLAFGVTDLIIWRMVGGLGVGAASVIALPTSPRCLPPECAVDSVLCSSWRS